MRVSVLSLALVSLFQLSAAQPRHLHQRHVHPRSFVSKRDEVTVTDAGVTAPAVIPEEVVVYADENGEPIRTATETVVVVPASASDYAATETDTESPAKSTPSSTSSTYEPKATTAAKNGVTYSPYKGDHNCKSAAEVMADFALFAKDFGVVRFYGVDCDQIANGYAAAKKYDNKLFLGIFDINAVPAGVKAIAAGVKNDWSVVDTVSVGNELVNNGGASVGQVLGAVKQARELLRAAGYKGPVVTVDTFNKATDHPELCNESDYCAVNMHPFFDPNTSAGNAGSFMTGAIGRLRAKLADKNQRIVITESGWPWKGNANGAAVPGMDNQAQAISSIKGAFSKNPADLMLFTAMNDMFKKPEAATFMAEQFWGMGGRYSPADK